MLKIPVEAFKNFDEENAVNIIANTFSESAFIASPNFNCTFNPLDKVVELYERILKEKNERIERLEKLIIK